MWHDGTLFHMFYHANGYCNGYIYDECYYASSPDLVTFTVPAIGPVMRIKDDIMAYDQTADCNISTDGTKCYFDYSSLDNRTPFHGSITRSEFDGTLAQLLIDFTVTVGAEI